MSKLSNAVATALFSLGSWGAMAQTAPADHTQHHLGDSVPAPTAQAPVPGPAAPALSDRMVAMDQQLHAMTAMREKLAAAKTPEERRVAMAEHLKTMHDSMAMVEAMKSLGAVGGMGMMGVAPVPSGAPGQPHAMAQGVPGGQSGMVFMMEGMHQRHQAMEKRMEMMESVVRMVMDRMQ